MVSSFQHAYAAHLDPRIIQLPQLLLADNVCCLCHPLPSRRGSLLRGADCSIRRSVFFVLSAQKFLLLRLSFDFKSHLSKLDAPSTHNIGTRIFTPNRARKERLFPTPCLPSITMTISALQPGYTARAQACLKPQRHQNRFQTAMQCQSHSLYTLHQPHV